MHFFYIDTEANAVKDYTSCLPLLPSQRKKRKCNETLTRKVSNSKNVIENV